MGASIIFFEINIIVFKTLYTNYRLQMEIFMFHAYKIIIQNIVLTFPVLFILFIFYYEFITNTRGEFLLSINCNV